MSKELVTGLYGNTSVSYSIARSQSHAGGVVALPIAGPGAQRPAIIRVCAPIEYESIAWAAVKEGGSPIVPSWKSFLVNPDPNAPADKKITRVFLGGTRSAPIPVSTFRGHFVAIYGSYDYVILDAEGLDSPFKLGIQPWERGSPSQGGIDPNFHYIPAENFVTDLLATRQLTQAEINAEAQRESNPFLQSAIPSGG